MAEVSKKTRCFCSLLFRHKSCNLSIFKVKIHADASPVQKETYVVSWLTTVVMVTTGKMDPELLFFNCTDLNIFCYIQSGRRYCFKNRFMNVSLKIKMLFRFHIGRIFFYHGEVMVQSVHLHVCVFLYCTKGTIWPGIFSSLSRNKSSCLIGLPLITEFS